MEETKLAGTKRTTTCYKHQPEGWFRERKLRYNKKAKNHLKKLALIWDNSGESHCSAATQLQALQPNPNLKHLCIKGCKGYKCPS